MDKLQCDYCNKVKNEVSFCIGASLGPEWTMHEGTGKVSCPECWELARQEGQEAIENHIKQFNRHAGAKQGG